MPARHLAIDLDRLRNQLDGINAFGRNPITGGFNRSGFSDADMAVRRWFASQLEAEGLSVRTDAVGNVFGRYGPTHGPCVMVGSHLDTVPEGGPFDGALGVAVAVECVRAMRHAALAPKTAIEVVATSEEEGRFGGMLGSQAIAGLATPEWLETAVDADGVRLVDAMRAVGLSPQDLKSASRGDDDIAAFLELHIEQGPVLETEGRPVGIVEAVSGLSYLHVVFEGISNHSGTTPMELRADAFAGVAELAVAIPDVIAKFGTGQSRITIGKVELQPNFPHTICGRAEFTLIVRDTDEHIIARLERELRDRLTIVAANHRLSTAIEERSRIAPTILDRRLVALLSEEAARLGISATNMPSGAGHDAQTMQVRAPSALIFVPSRGGISHAPDEWTDWADIEKGANLILAALVRLTR